MARKWSLDPALYTSASGSTDQYYMDQMKQQDITPVSTDPSKPKFKLIVGPSPFSMPRGWEFFLTAPYEGATYIATVLANAGYAVEIVDVRYALDPLRDAYQACLTDTDVVGVCSFEDNFPFVEEFIQHIKFARPEVPVLVGGSLVTSVPQVFLQHTKMDVGIISEGEITILEVMDSIHRGSLERDLPSIRGVVYRGEGGEMKRTPPRGQTEDLDHLPRMRLDLWPDYHSEKGLQGQIIASYSRGCKMDCSFCYRTTPQVRSKSPEILDRDLRWLKSEYDVDFIFFVDLTFTSYKQQTLEVCEVIQQNDVRWTCLTRCADVDKERLDAMKKANCDIVLYGVESLGANVLKEARKGNTENITVRSMHSTWDADLRFGALFIVGLPNETEESLEHMCSFAEEYNHVTRVKYLSAMPGTTVYTEAIRDGLMKSEVDHIRWLSIEQALYEDEFLNYNGLPEHVVRNAYKRIYDAYQPGPVMDFNHYPEHFLYHHPNADDATERSTEYAGKQWRAEHSSATPRLYPGSERYTFEQVGTPGMQEYAKIVPCGAKRETLVADPVYPTMDMVASAK